MPNNDIVPRRGELAPFTGTSKHQPISWNERSVVGTQLVFRFPNGYGASLINGPGSYGYELAVTKFYGPGDDDWHLCYDTPVTSDVLGWLGPDDIEAALDQINALPAATPEVTA